MKGIPSKNNFYVFNVLTNEKKEFKTLSDIAREYNINYYTARELNRITENDTEKNFLHKKLAAEDTGYLKRREAAETKAKKSHLKKQQWMDSVLDDEPSYDGFESKRVMRCSDFIILEKKREEVLKDADKKFPNLKKAEMKKMLKDQEKGAKDFKQKSKKYFGWAKDPEAAAAAFIRKATGKEPKDL